MEEWQAMGVMNYEMERNPADHVCKVRAYVRRYMVAVLSLTAPSKRSRMLEND